MVAHSEYHYPNAFPLESGGELSGFTLRYCTLGQLNAARDNVIWVCHAFSGSADFTEWWPGLFENDPVWNRDEYFIICVNMLGSCYGSTGPLSTNPDTGRPYYHSFPRLTNRDMVAAFDLLRQHLGIDQIHTAIGPSMGGQHALEWAVSQPGVIQHLISIGSNARHSPWGIAFNETQRMAIESDITWSLDIPEAGLEGMKVARAAALLSYRNYKSYKLAQSEDAGKTDDYRASSYQRYQGEKLARRFNALTYWSLSKAMDSHDVGRGRGDVDSVLRGLEVPSLFVGVESDTLFPSEEQQHMSRMAPKGSFFEISSDFGHDGFLVDTDQLATGINQFYERVGTKIIQVS